MAAITFKFGVESDISAVDSLAGELPPVDEAADADEALLEEGLDGLGRIAPGGLGRFRPARIQRYTAAELGPDFADEEIKADIINVTHAGLEQMLWLRRTVAEMLAGRSFGLVVQGRDVRLVMDEPLPQIPAWNPPTQEGQRTASVLSWTTKMGCPSFSLPAGAVVMGGTCPGANAGQTVVPVETLRARAREVRAVTGSPVSLAQAICQHCYAEGGQYSTGGVQYAQLIRLAWTRAALADGSFVPTMVWAIDNANFKLAGEPDGHRYFRIHDSGDLFSPDYFLAWKEIANQLPDITFWSPSRVWVSPTMRDLIGEVNAPPTNLVVRPSSFHVNQPPPRTLGPGWARGATAYKDLLKPPGPMVEEPGRPYDWDCQAYMTGNDKVTCRDALDPAGHRGCRACWKYGYGDFLDSIGFEINYTLH